MSDDSEVNEESDAESLSDVKVDDRVTVSVLGRVAKRPPILGCVLQASVTRWCVFEVLK